MKSLTDCYKLGGVEIPCIGLGTWQTNEGDEVISAVLDALRLGYRHIDTAAAYGNERGVGEAVRRSGVPRGELFITSKLPNDMHGYDETLLSFEQSLERLGTDYLDLYLIHWPNPKQYRDHWQRTSADTWRAFENLLSDGRVRAIGVSNFRRHHIDELLKTASVVPAVNQIRLCPGDTQEDVVACCREHGILPEAYSPFGTGEIFKVEKLRAMAEKYGRTVAQVCVRWSLQMGFLPLPKSVSAARIAENADVFGFELDAGDVAALSGMDGCCGYSIDPDTAWF